MEKYIEILDNPAVTSREQFMLTCSAAGLEIDDAKYRDIMRYEVEQLTKIQKLKPMFYGHPDESLWEYKKHFHLVLSAGEKTDDNLTRYFEVRIPGMFED